MTNRLWIEISLADRKVNGIEALEIRKAITAEIKKAAMGEMRGGGVSLDGSSADFEIETSQPDAEQHIRTILSQHGVTKFTIEKI
jgi:hypothetical protein